MHPNPENLSNLSKEEATKIAETSSRIFIQGNTWVLSELDWDTGAIRLTRGLTEKVAKTRLTTWRKERVEKLLRASEQASAFTLRVWKENPTWQGAGIWQWMAPRWYTSREDAQNALESYLKNRTSKLSQPADVTRSLETASPPPPSTLLQPQYEIYELKTSDLPGHFSLVV